MKQLYDDPAHQRIDPLGEDRHERGMRLPQITAGDRAFPGKRLQGRQPESVGVQQLRLGFAVEQFRRPVFRGTAAYPAI